MYGVRPARGRASLLTWCENPRAECTFRAGLRFYDALEQFRQRRDLPPEFINHVQALIASKPPA